MNKYITNNYLINSHSDYFLNRQKATTTTPVRHVNVLINFNQKIGNVGNNSRSLEEKATIIHGFESLSSFVKDDCNDFI